MSQLMEELSSTENRIAFARQAFNDFSTQYNITREKFPNILIANMFSFSAARLFELDSPREAEVVRVALS
jgi:LemA protein